MKKKSDLKVVKIIKIGEVIEVDGNFFYISKVKVDKCHMQTYFRYHLKTMAKKSQIDKIKKLVKEGEI